MFFPDIAVFRARVSADVVRRAVWRLRCVYREFTWNPRANTPVSIFQRDSNALRGKFYTRRNKELNHAEQRQAMQAARDHNLRGEDCGHPPGLEKSREHPLDFETGPEGLAENLQGAV